MGCPPGLRAENYNQYVLVIYTPEWNEFVFDPRVLSLDSAERLALTWNSRSTTGLIATFCIGIIRLRDYEDVREKDVVEAMRWFEERTRWRRQSSEPAPVDVFVQTFDPLNMSYGHCLGCDVPTNASWQPVGKIQNVIWPQDSASAREQKLQDENQALRDQLQLLENENREQLDTIHQVQPWLQKILVETDPMRALVDQVSLLRGEIHGLKNKNDDLEKERSEILDLLSDETR